MSATEPDVRVPAPGPCGDRIIAVDPGRAKCGVACLSVAGVILARGIVPQDRVAEWVAAAGTGGSSTVVVGNGTGMRAVGALLDAAGIAWRPTDEAGTSEMARTRYLSDHPARGLRRLVPPGLRTPDEAYDDYVAVILAERVARGIA
jgi:hypothetical protein